MNSFSDGGTFAKACFDFSQAFRSIQRNWQSLNQDVLALKSGTWEMSHGVSEASPN